MKRAMAPLRSTGSFLGAYAYVVAALLDSESGDLLKSIPLLGLAVLGACIIVLVQGLIIRTHLRGAVTDEAEKLVRQHERTCRAELNVRLEDMEADLAVLGELERQVTRLEQCVSDLKELLRRDAR